MKFRFFSHLFDISSHEWPRVFYSFGLEFFLVVAHTFGHAILIAVTTEQFGAAALPYLWIVAAFFTIVATAIFTPLVEKFDKKKLVYWLGAGSALFLGAAFVALAHEMNPLVFFGLALVGMSAIGGVLHITVSMLVEGLFSPLEAERVFPFISSSALVGGAVAGGVITLLTGSHFHWGVTELTLLWAISVALVLVVNLLYSLFSAYSPHFKNKDEKGEGMAHELREAAHKLLEMPFVRNLAVIVFIQYVVVQLLEFQYATALAEGSAHSEEHLIHGLGFYGAIFSVSGLLVQMTFSRRVVHKLGIVRTMLVNPLLSIIPFSFMAAKFGAPSAVTSKLVFESTNVISRNAYLASFYAIPELIREKVKPLIEGWLVPLGAIFGTLILIALELFFHTAHGEVPHEMTLAVSIALIVLAVVMAFKLWQLKDHYTQLSVKNLRSSEKEEKHVAIEILAQRGHKNGPLHLTKALGYHKKDPELKSKILEVLGYSRDSETVPAILDHLQDEEFQVRYQAVQALNHFESVGQHFYEQAFARYRISHALEELFKAEKSQRLKQEIIKTFAHLNQVEIVPFLLEVLRKEDDDHLLSDTIAVISSFHDPNIAHYLKGFIAHQNPHVRANTIIALWQFPRYRMDLLMPQVKMMSAPDKESILATLWMLGEIKNKAEIPRLHKFLEHEDDEIRWWAALALAKMGEREAEDHLLQALLHDDERIAEKFGRHVQRTHPRVHARLQRSLKHEVSHRISELFKKCNHDVNALSQPDFAELVRLYRLLGAQAEVARLVQIRVV